MRYLITLERRAGDIADRVAGLAAASPWRATWSWGSHRRCAFRSIRGPWREDSLGRLWFQAEGRITLFKEVCNEPAFLLLDTGNAPIPEEKRVAAGQVTDTITVPFLGMGEAFETQALGTQKRAGLPRALGACIR